MVRRFVDCENVVRAGSKPIAVASGHKSLFGSFWKAISNLGGCGEVVKVKAHVSDPSDAPERRINDSADRQAQAHAQAQAQAQEQARQHNKKSFSVSFLVLFRLLSFWHITLGSRPDPKNVLTALNLTHFLYLLGTPRNAEFLPHDPRKPPRP